MRIAGTTVHEHSNRQKVSPMKHETVMIPRRTDTVAFPDAQTSAQRRQRIVVVLAACVILLTRPTPRSTIEAADAALAASF